MIGKPGPHFRWPQGRHGPISREDAVKRMVAEGSTFEDAINTADDNMKRIWRLQERSAERRREQCGNDNI